jgi:hypothetical protein
VSSDTDAAHASGEAGHTMATPNARTDGPDWIRDAVAVARQEIRRFVATGVAFCVRPQRFAASWVAGDEHALNPLGCMATALAVTGTLGAFVPGNGESGALAALAAAILPYVYYVVLGLLCHPLLRLSGSTRRLRVSVAMALFGGAGPGLVVALSSYVAIWTRVALFGPYHEDPSSGLPTAAFVALLVWIFVPAIFLLPITMALALAGAHGVRRRTAACALLIAFVVAGVIVGQLHARHHFSLGVPHFVLYVFRWRPWPSIHD